MIEAERLFLNTPIAPVVISPFTLSVPGITQGGENCVGKAPQNTKLLQPIA